MVRAARLAYVEAMDDDFNTPKALGCVFDFVSAVNALLDGLQLSAPDKELAMALRTQIVEFLTVLGIDFDAVLAADVETAETYPAEFMALAAEVAGYAGDNGEEAAAALIDARARARAEKNWAVADGIRDRLAALGFSLKDTPQGCRLERA